ncbi:CDP-alcohol phosphatidyltransferase family protein [Planosporangium thailandense]|uniref:CDP-alcohol phosphatidyltransferase family protein n=1 Tax=Planosporangium thailandense TaxID=765197 RepID=A0ABX0XWX1_9ACTN|nr:CDP-alcohol phosphatidyltransferase family protein [Planosporangium thailandense]
MTVGLGATGWLTGVGYGLVVCAALTRGLSRAGAGALGPADRVTLTRATLVGGVAALTADSVMADSLTTGSIVRQAPVGMLVALAAVALVLDAVDGRVARRTGTVSALGARFDMEIDAFLLLVLGAYVTPSMGAWVLSIGAMRYAFVAASWVLPWMRGTLPPRYWRKVVAATQGVVLVVAAADALPRPVTAAVLVASLALLVESFGRDVAWLWRHRTVRPAHRHAARSLWTGPTPRLADRTGARPTEHRAVGRAA